MSRGMPQHEHGDSVMPSERTASHAVLWCSAALRLLCCPALHAQLPPRCTTCRRVLP